MPEYHIAPGALKMAWKMIDTIFPRVAIPKGDQDYLLNSITLIALSDLLDDAVFWSETAPWRFRLVFGDHEVFLQVHGRSRDVRAKSGWLRSRPSDRAVDAAFDRSNSICDKWGFDEEERDSLFTAIPCLGLHALKGYLVWRSPPPFPELI